MAKVTSILTWTQANSGQTAAQRYELGYDNTDQLRSAALKNTSNQAIVKQYYYDYDGVGNRKTEQIDSATTTSGYNNLNQLTSRAGGGSMVFEGSLSEPATVTIGGNAASVDGSNQFKGTATVSVGANSIPIIATDANGNQTAKHIQVTVSGGASQTLTYDLLGNLTDDGSKTYEWDAANRLIAINSGTHRTEMSYDGQSRESKRVEKENGAVTETKQFIWGEWQRAEERDANNQVTKRFYAQGEQIDGGNYFYSRDHLRSVRELTNSAGTVRARYDYDSYGTRTKLSGDLEADFGFTGDYVSGQYSDLAFAPLRVYSVNLGRWISRDPIGEVGGINLYGYVGNNPANLTDPLGLTWASNINFLFDWLSGGGSNSRSYNPSSVETTEMQNSPGADALRDEFYNTDCKGVRRFGYGSARAAWDTLLNPWTADWSSTGAQVGGFDRATAVNNGDGTVTFTIPNTAGAHSFFYHASFVPDRTGTTGPMRNINQTFTWTEPIGP